MRSFEFLLPVFYSCDNFELYVVSYREHLYSNPLYTPTPNLFHRADLQFTSSAAPGRVLPARVHH